jgi:hypothetical protein
MLPTFLKHYWLGVTTIALAALLSTISVGANPIANSVQGQRTDGSISGTFANGQTVLASYVTSLTKAVPQQAGLILVGSGLLGLAFGIRRMTARKEADDKSHSEEPKFSIDIEPEADYPEAELADPAAPLLRQNASGQTDSLSLSQPSLSR